MTSTKGQKPTEPGASPATPAGTPVDATNDQAWKQNFPQAAASPSNPRESYQQTADERRAQAELAAKLEAARKQQVEGTPTPTGEGENPHEDEPAVDPEDPNPTKPEPA